MYFPSDSTDCFSNHLESLPFTLASTTDSLHHRFVYDYLFENTMPQEMALSTPCRQSYTPPNSPALHSSSLADAANRLEKLLDKFVHALEKVSDKVEVGKPEVAQDVKADEPRVRATKLEYKQVDEVYATCSALRVC